MPNKDELILMGNRLVSKFLDKASQGGDLAQWNKECALSCDILLGAVDLCSSNFVQYSAF